MANERETDFFIGKLLDLAKIDYTPNGSNIKEIQEALKTASKKGTGKAGFPEFVAKSKDFVIVIEDKADIEKQAKYEDEENTTLATDVKAITDFAENGALHYAKEIIQKTAFKKLFAFGCSGDERHHLIRPIFVTENEYKLLETVENFENFSEANIEKYYKEQVLGETPPEILETTKLQKKAAELHEALRNYGQLGDKEKPLVVSAILLALQDVNFKIENLIGHKRSTDGLKIFNAVKNYLYDVEVSPEVKLNKVLNQFNIIKDRTLLNQVDERLAKTPLRYFTEFIHTNILASIQHNVKEDVLGNFYGEFMRYSGGDGQTLGVVLTPHHIAELFCDLVEINKDDRVFDPCCGTAGFLISAMHRMEHMTDDPEEKRQIKSHQLHGIEVREDMFSIATTNMVLRDDGQSNLIPANFLSKTVEELRQENYTVGFMNPPYSQAKGKDTAHLSEIHFTKHLLDALADGGRCAVIVPQSTMVGKSKEDKKVKKQILEKHTLEGVITLNKETFYRIGTNPCIAVFTAHKPHSEKKYVKFVNFENDGFEINKHIGLVETERAKEKKAQLLNCWLHDAPAETKFMVKTTITAQDEWLHSFYYFNDEIPKAEDFEKTMADYLTFEFSMVMQGRQYLFENDREENTNTDLKKKAHLDLKTKEWGEFKLSAIFTIENCKCSKVTGLQNGNMPYVGATNRNNGVLSFVKPAQNLKTKGNCIAFICDGEGSVGYSIYKKEDFIGSTTVKVGRNKFLNKYTGSFITTIADTVRSKYNFGFKRNAKHLKNETLILPINSQNEPDYSYMENYMRAKEEEKEANFKHYISKRIKDLAKENIQEVISLSEKEWGEFEIEVVFNIKAGKRLTKADMKKGKKPFIGATEYNNGITEYVSNINSSEDFNVLGVNYNGSVVESFYHPYKALFSDDIRRLSYKNTKGNKHLYLFAKAQILKQKSKYQYGYKFNGMRMKRQKIMLPINSQNEPDYSYMEEYMQALELQKLQGYLAYKD